VCHLQGPQRLNNSPTQHNNHQQQQGLMKMQRQGPAARVCHPRAVDPVGLLCTAQMMKMVTYQRLCRAGLGLGAWQGL
jgi:hypothetical protein